MELHKSATRANLIKASLKRRAIDSTRAISVYRELGLTEKIGGLDSVRTDLVQEVLGGIDDHQQLALATFMDELRNAMNAMFPTPVTVIREAVAERGLDNATRVQVYRNLGLTLDGGEFIAIDTGALRQAFNSPEEREEFQQNVEDVLDEAA